MEARADAGLLAVHVLAQQIAAAAQSARECSAVDGHHSMASAHTRPARLTLVALGVVVVIVTTIYSLLYLMRPGETAEDHIKRRILEDGTRGSR